MQNPAASVLAATSIWIEYLNKRKTPAGDCLLAALALESDCEIFSVDTHFRRIHELALYSPD